tara:strand:+ start:400 stop:1221 length:822 start_codon:yes stop_codon:yes gene_type:complete
MAINYTFLDPDSPFTADALNTRFDASIGTLQGVNNLLPEDLAVGAFRHNHIPRLIHQDGKTLTELTEQVACLFGDGNRFSVMLNNAFTEGAASSPAVPLMQLDYGATALNLAPAVDVTMDLSDSAENVGAIVVLANISVVKLVVSADPHTYDFPAEDRHYAKFVIRITDSAGTSVDLEKTRRTLSPRITISINSGTSFPVNAGLITSSTTRDSRTNQDVSIRTVITPSDLTAAGLNDVNKIELMSEYTDAFTTTHTGKGNLTAVPIHTKLVSS